MKKKAPPSKKLATKQSVVADRKTSSKPEPDLLTPLVAEVRELIQSARRGVASVVDTFQVLTNFEIGRRIVEHEQQGAKRAAYGKEVLKELSVRQTGEFGPGFSMTSLKLMRQFFVEFRARISQAVSDQSSQILPIGQTASDQLKNQLVKNQRRLEN